LKNPSRPSYTPVVWTGRVFFQQFSFPFSFFCRWLDSHLFSVSFLLLLCVCVCVGGKQSWGLQLEDLPEEPCHHHLIRRQSQERQGTCTKFLLLGLSNSGHALRTCSKTSSSPQCTEAQDTVSSSQKPIRGPIQLRGGSRRPLIQPKAHPGPQPPTQTLQTPSYPAKSPSRAPATCNVGT
jgi:hypothetical protein